MTFMSGRHRPVSLITPQAFRHKDAGTKRRSQKHGNSPSQIEALLYAFVVES
jgi:hypothetical protein